MTTRTSSLATAGPHPASGIHIEASPGPEFYGKFTGVSTRYGINRTPLRVPRYGCGDYAVRIDGACMSSRRSRRRRDVTDIVLNLKTVVLKAAQAKTYTSNRERGDG